MEQIRIKFEKGLNASGELQVGYEATAVCDLGSKLLSKSKCHLLKPMCAGWGGRA